MVLHIFVMCCKRAWLIARQQINPLRNKSTQRGQVSSWKSLRIHQGMSKEAEWASLGNTSYSEMIFYVGIEGMLEESFRLLAATPHDPWNFMKEFVHQSPRNQELFTNHPRMSYLYCPNAMLLQDSEMGPWVREVTRGIFQVCFQTKGFFTGLLLSILFRTSSITAQ